MYSTQSYFQFQFCFSAGAVHATDYSNASATAIFDSYQVSYCNGVIAVVLSTVAITFGLCAESRRERQRLRE